MSDTIDERMDDALAKLAGRWPRRTPKAFYLNAEDWDAFTKLGETLGLVMVRVPWGNNPVKYRDDPSFNGVPVRESQGKASSLYDNTSTGHGF